MRQAVGLIYKNIKDKVDSPLDKKLFEIITNVKHYPNRQKTKYPILNSSNIYKLLNKYEVGIKEVSDVLNEEFRSVYSE